MEAVSQYQLVSHSQPQQSADPIANPVPSPSTENGGPVPLSFPSILRNPGLTSRYAHLVEKKGPPPAPVQPKKAWRRYDNEGKRWVRRRENGTFYLTVYATLPSPGIPPLHNTTSKPPWASGLNKFFQLTS